MFFMTKKNSLRGLSQSRQLCGLCKGSICCGLGDSLDAQSPGRSAVFAFTTPFLTCQSITDTLKTLTRRPQASLAFKCTGYF